MKSILAKSLGLVVLLTVCQTASLDAQTKKAKDGRYTYEYVENDPLQTRIYTLQNGMKAYMSVNKDEPRIQTAIAVRAGCKEDPRDNTGLAHYLEHMVFKGTDQIGSADWEKEQKLIKKIGDLYEKHKAETDTSKKAAIYKEIDEVSYEASKLAIPNEYDKMISSLGAKYTNAYTSTDETVYINNIPATGLDKWLMVESERFRKLVLRLFHTELEAVYEEFNMGQDRDGSKVYQAMLSALFPTHPYQVSTIGKGEHLKNPSHVAIHNYFDTYYVPNNMAICLSGDFDFSETIQKIDAYFGKFERKDFERPKYELEKPMTEDVVKEVYGNEAEYVMMAYRFDGAGSRDAMLLKLMNGILKNGRAGIMDLNLLQKQKILSGSAYEYAMNDHAVHVLNGKAREGQSLEEVQQLLAEQVTALKNGDFDESLIDAVIKNFKLKALKDAESNWGRYRMFVDAFISDKKWEDVVNELDELSKVTKQDIVDFANEKYKHCAIIYKRSGEDTTVLKMQKPPITQIEMNRESQSPFFQKFSEVEENRLKPAFLDYKNEIESHALKSGIKVNYIKNKINPTFNLYYILDMGTKHDAKMALAVKYLPYLGTDKYSAEELQKEFYRLGLSFDIYTASERIYVSLSGLEESFTEGLVLFEHILKNAKPDETALKGLIDDVFKKREDAKKDKNTIFWRALYSYGAYGEKSEFTDILSEKELKSITADELVSKIKELLQYQHSIFYYGQNDAKDVVKTLGKYHKTPRKLKAYPTPPVYTELETKKDKVIFVNYDMVQAKIMMLSKDQTFNPEVMPAARVFGEYFGGGLSSIVFQEIREARALAYSAFAGYRTPSQADKSHFVQAVMSVQADKMKDAITAMRELLNEMPKAEQQFEGSRVSVLKQLETERITKTRAFFDYLNAKDLGLDYDIRESIYKKGQKMSFADLETFFNEYIKDRNYNFLVMGNKETLDMEYLKSLGDVQEVTLEELFGY